MISSRFQSLRRELAPVEHGSWGLFFIPLAVGVLTGRGDPIGQGLLTISALGVFLMRRPALRWLRAFNRESLDSIRTVWPGQALAVSAGLALLGGIPLLCLGHPYLILVFGLAVGILFSEIYLAEDLERHPLLSELVEVWVLCLLAPSAYYVGTGHLNDKAAVLWTLCAVYFSVAIGDIRVRLARFRVARGLAEESLISKRKTERLVITWVSLAGILLIYALAPRHLIALLALAPLLIRPFYASRRSAHRATDIASLGWSEVYLSLVFAALAAFLI